MIDSDKLRRKYIGCMLGAAMGDALGKQNEGRKRDDILTEGYITDYGKAPPGSPGDKLRAGMYTDDTDQMLVLAASLIRCRGFDVRDFAKRFAQWGADAMADRTRSPLLGPSSSRAITHLSSGSGWEESGSHIPSCGSSMRVAPIGLFYKDLDAVESMAALSSIPTHNSKNAIGGAVAVAIGVRCAIEEMECCDIIRESCSRASKYDTVLARKIELSFEKRNEEPDEVFSELGTSYLVYETVPSAFYCFSRHSGSPEKAVIEAVNAGGDTDSIACITGALCGALNGTCSFPRRWINGLENKERIENAANQIFELSPDAPIYKFKLPGHALK